MKPKKTSKNQSAPPDSLHSVGSASGATFQTLFESARKSPIYWLEGLNIEHGERLIKLKDQLKRTAYYNTEKQLHLKGQINATRKSLREVKRVMSECEKMPNAECSEPAPDDVAATQD